ncbi:MAG: tyrosine-type recombinase/integrase, partial [Solirubrobacteraceae bacterium]
DGWTQARAQDALQDELAKVQLGTWTPPEPEPAPVVEQDPTFHVFATEWVAAHEGEWRESTRLDYEWQLSHHLLKFFRRHRLSQITIAEVDRYRALKVKQGKLSATSINKTITRLAQILEVAVEYGMIERNPARGKRRRLKASKPAPVWLDSAEQIAALLDAAGELDRTVHTNGAEIPRRAILSALVFSGLRIGELIELRWRDVDLAAGKITVRSSKTDAGVRTIDLLPILRAELEALREAQGRGGTKVISLEAHRAAKDSGEAPTLSSSRVFPTQGGGPMNPSNVRNRILAKATERANERREAAGQTPLPDGLSPHKLRHTFASLLVALGTDPGAVMDQLGHTDPTFTPRVYRHGMRRDEGSKQALADLVKRHRKGTKDAEGVVAQG